MTKCPTCGSEEVRRSRRKSLLSMVQRWRGLRRYRCRECRHVFYNQLSPGEHEVSLQRSQRLRERLAARSKRSNKHTLRRRATELLLFLCLVVIFYAALKYLARVP